MQHLGAEDQMQLTWRDLLASLPPEERLEGLSPEQRLEGLSPEDRLRGLSPEELEQLRKLLETRTQADKSSRPE
jgi:hypothetical protein